MFLKLLKRIKNVHEIPRNEDTVWVTNESVK